MAGAGPLVEGLEEGNREELSVSWMMSDYECPDCGEFEAMERRSECETSSCPDCGQECSRKMPAPLGRMALVSAACTTGTSLQSDLPKALDTSALADGMSTKEWKQRRSKWRRNRRIDEIRSKI